MASVEVIKDWDGDELIARARRATGRGFIGISARIEANAKRFVHVMSGDLRRSIHSARAGSGGFAEARSGRDAQMPGDSDRWLLEVGSWLDYACVEEVGRGHQFMHPAIEAVADAPAFAIMKQAWMEEGL